MILSFKKQNKTELINEINTYLQTDIKHLYNYTAWACGSKNHAEQVITNAFKKVERDIYSRKKIKNIKSRFHQALEAQCDKQRSISVVSKKITPSIFKTDKPDNAFQLVLNKVPERYSHPLVMQVVGHFSIPEIANALKISEQEVSVSLSAARRMVSALVALEQTISSTNKIETKMTPAKSLNDLLVGAENSPHMCCAGI